MVTDECDAGLLANPTVAFPMDTGMVLRQSQVRRPGLKHPIAMHLAGEGQLLRGDRQLPAQPPVVFPHGLRVILAFKGQVERGAFPAAHAAMAGGEGRRHKTCLFQRRHMQQRHLTARLIPQASHQVSPNSLLSSSRKVLMSRNSR